MVKVLFVCMGNICRSPTAEAVFKKMVKEAGLTDKVIVDSAGTHGYHVGEAPDVRAQIAGRKRGYDLSELRARQITSDDFRECDFILAMDWENLTAMQQICPPMYKHKLALLMRYATEYDTAWCMIRITAATKASTRCLITVRTPAKACLKLLRNALPSTFPAQLCSR